ncbi:MAG: SpoIID/LytB domain-containing protein, partial [Oscillospiraceae bacterium]|nr:SpoIID/LytB domain-containing protein [Oscillospiraceae bacterium]
FQFRRVTNGGNLTVSNFLPLDDYAECVASREMSASWPIEALKAQAVCARNFYEQKLADHKHRAQGFDICNTTHCQVYYGMASTNERTAQAVAETSGLRIWYQGKQAEIYYYSSNGGATEACKNVWTADLPYLVGQIDPYEPTVADKIYHYSWTVTYTAQEIADLLRKKGYNCADIVDFQVTARTEAGNVRAITFTDANGKTYSFYKDNARTFLGLRSLRFTVAGSNAPATNNYVVNGGDILSSATGAYVIGGDGTVSQVFENLYVMTASGVEQLPVSSAPASSTSADELVFTIQGTGTGHHVGMSQWGAYAMAQQGFTFDKIIKFYFPGVEIY